MKNLLLLLFIGFSSLVIAQEDMLPKGLTQAERELINSYKFQYNGPKQITTPPVGGEIRTPGQWEEVQAVCITWTGFPSIHRQLVSAIQAECEVWISHLKPREYDQIQKELQQYPGSQPLHILSAGMIFNI